MQFIDLESQYARIQPALMQSMARVLDTQHYIMGPEVFELEQRLADYVGVKHALSCSSGTDALVIALMVQNLTRKDAVFVPSFTFFASAESISLAGATPVFVDSEPDSFNLSLQSLKDAYAQVVREGRLNPRGIIAVDLFGLPADWDELQRFACEKGLFLVEDAAQGFGGRYKDKKVGSFGDVAATSFFPAKPLGCYGDGGAIFTNDDETAALMRSVRVHGEGVDKYDNVRVGLNGRLDTLQAAVLLHKMDIFDSELVAREQVAAAYTQALQGALVAPSVPAHCRSAWAQYSLVAATPTQREAILAALSAADIPSAVYYRIPIHLSVAYQHLGYLPGSLPVCEDLSGRIFSLPMHPYLSAQDITRISTTVLGAL
ncbi:MAG: DegT/DnrJ/EryC1/StrS family aminotransferase [Coriobacteriales bacterium]|nr:DegT/DnrJ/EryC1/StrS family aminotransferase [Coriobacteriales bacterium]